VTGLALLLATSVCMQGGQTAPLSEADAVRLALQNSPKLRAVRMEAHANQAQVERERPVARPDITLEAEGRLQGPRVTFPKAGNGDVTVVPERYGKVELSIEQILYRAGLGAARERYAAQTRGNEWEALRAENDLIHEVRRAYFSLLSAQAMAEVARGGVDLARKQLDQTKLMLEAGTASERDVKVGDADLAEAEQGALRAENGMALARANLNRVMGRDPASPVTVATAPPAPEVPAGPEEGITLALKRRPEVRQLEESLRAARAGVSLARSQSSPSLSARASSGAQTPSAFARSHYYAAGLVMTWNPFDTGKVRADVQEAQAQAGRLDALLEEAKLGIRLEVEKAWRDMVEARSRIASAERQVAAAEAALDVSQLRYQAGSAIQLEVSGSLFKVIQARSNRAMAVFDLHLASADYAHATGADVPEQVKSK
jgi:outer membrane protein